MSEPDNCFPTGCRCCECQGKHCLIPHPGHSCGAKWQRLAESSVPSRPLLDLKTLEAVHEYYEFEAKSDTQMDRWLHEEILRAKKGRDLTPEERKAHLDF